MRNGHKKILLGQLASMGDCLYATSIARQIKIDFPGSHLTWAIGSIYRSILQGNPDVDAIWEIPLKTRGEVDTAWRQFEIEALERKKKGEFDEVYLTQLHPGNLQNYDGLIRSSIFRGYPNRIKVPVTPVIKLSDIEIRNVSQFAEKHRLRKKNEVILFESSPESEQSHVTHNFAIELSERLFKKFQNIAVILSSKRSFQSKDDQIIDGSVLSFRENAELTKYCSLLIGCSSGITWLATSDWAKPLPMIQLLKKDAPYPASVALDFKRWGLPADKVIEMTDYSVEKVSNCVAEIFHDGFKNARSKFHEEIKPYFYETHKNILFQLLMRGKILKGGRFYFRYIWNFGFHKELLKSIISLLNMGRMKLFKKLS